MKDRDDDDRPKKSWREIDKMRDRSRHVSSARPDAPQARERSKLSKAALDRAFRDGLVGKLLAEKERGAAPPDKSRRPELVKKIRISESRAEVNAALDDLLSFSELPDDWDVLTRALDHERAEVVRRALTHILGLLARERPARKAALLQRVIGLADGADDESRELATRVRDALG